MIVHLIDGTFELFRHFYAVPPASDRDGREVGATVGVLNSVLRLLESGATHVGVATDHVIESFRNSLWSGYKTGDGIDPALFSQFHPLEAALRSMGVVVWPMIELEADDGLASAARIAAADPRVTQVMICTPDKDLSQAVVGDRVVQFDRMRRQVRNEPGVVAKFGVPPASIPDWLALVGDTADGYPGLPGWGEKSAATVLAHYGHIEAIPRIQPRGRSAFAVRPGSRPPSRPNGIGRCSSASSPHCAMTRSCSATSMNCAGPAPRLTSGSSPTGSMLPGWPSGPSASRQPGRKRHLLSRGVGTLSSFRQAFLSLGQGTYARASRLSVAARLLDRFGGCRGRQYRNHPPSRCCRRSIVRRGGGL